MKLKILLAVFLLAGCSEAREKCSSEIIKEEECSSTEYMSYVECMRKRTKRSTDCCDGDDCNQTSDSCDDCDCDYCSSNDCSSECSSCCETSQPCTTVSCCHQTCNRSCRTSRCRKNCRSSCSKTTDRSSGTSSKSKNEVRNESKHNITTVINLHNVINNTNLIDIPINVTNTNINNITLEAPITNDVHAGGYPAQEIPVPTYPQPQPQPEQQSNCCKVVGPRQCAQTSTYPYSKCFHYSKSHCGDLCKTYIMHAERHDICDQEETQNCHQQIAYIPQPQPRCSSTTQWPYVHCSIERPECQGCYGHVVQGGSRQEGCSNFCYDEGYNVGPMYRQGPAFQPAYSHVPPCIVTGTCGEPYYGGGGGGYPYGAPMMGGGNPYDNSFAILPDMQDPSAENTTKG